MTALLEIIVPVHNIKDRSHHLQELLAKRIQTDTKFIIVSDSESDSDHFRVRQLIQESLHPEAMFLSGSFGGPGAARNAGVSASDSKWICFLDSDDDIDLVAVHSLILEAGKSEADILIGGLILRFKNQQTDKKYFLDSDISLHENLSLTPAFTRMVFRRTFLRGSIFPNFKMAEDQCFVLDLFNLDPVVLCSEIYFYTYNIGMSEQSTKDFASLKDLSKSVRHSSSRLSVSKFEVRQMATTMVIRQSLTFLSNLGIVFDRSFLDVLGTLLKLFVLHPVNSVRSIFLIINHRPRGFS